MRRGAPLRHCVASSVDRFRRISSFLSSSFFFLPCVTTSIKAPTSTTFTTEYHDCCCCDRCGSLTKTFEARRPCLPSSWTSPTGPPTKSSASLRTKARSTPTATPGRGASLLRLRRNKQNQNGSTEQKHTAQSWNVAACLHSEVSRGTHLWTYGAFLCFS